MRKFRIGVCVLAYVVVLMLLCTCSSPLSGVIRGDQAVFTVMGRGMAEGKIMYKDLFDHKGWYLYVINYLGVLLSGRSPMGVFIIEALFMTVTALFAYALIRREAGGKTSWLALMVFLLLAVNRRTLFTGNMTEEFALPFQMLSIYLVVKYLDGGGTEHNASYMFLHGVSAGIVMFLRPNLVMMWGAIGLLVGAGLLRRKDFAGFFRNFGAGLLGVMAGVAPAVIYAVATDSVSDMIFGMFIYNMIYIDIDSSTSVLGLLKRLVLIREPSLYFTLIVPVIISAVLVFRRAGEKSRAVYYCLMLGASYLCASLAGRGYGHYYECLVPFCIPFACWGASRLVKYRYSVIVVLVMTLFLGAKVPNIVKDIFIAEFPGLAKTTMIGKGKRAVDILPYVEHNEPYSSEHERMLVTGYSGGEFFANMGIMPQEKYFYIPATRGNKFSDPAEAQISSLISGVNDVIIIKYDEGGIEILSRYGRDNEINAALNEMYNLLYYDETNNIAMYGRK